MQFYSSRFELFISRTCSRVEMNDKKMYNFTILSDYLLKELEGCSPQYRDFVANLLSWLSSTPRYTVYRVNTLAHSSDEIKSILCTEMLRQALGRGVTCPSVFIHPELKDVVIIDSWELDSLKLNKKNKEVIVDVSCGAAVLRGSNIYAPGIKGMPLDTNPGDVVSIYVDIKNKCTRGFTSKFLEDKCFIGNGVVKIGRSNLFGKNATLKGLAVEVTDSLRGVPCLPQDCVPTTHALLQNLPSCLCCKVLNPQPGETILDMCASPGNKTTHLAMLMSDKGIIIALDKTNSKIQTIKNRCEKFDITCVKCFVFDATKAVSQSKKDVPITECRKEEFDSSNSLQRKDSENTQTDIIGLLPPFPCESFDRILLDAPCSALGQRPLLFSKISLSQLNSYPPLQKKLFQSAVSLLKPGGSLVYSTCTVTVAENEHMVVWALNKYPCLQLENIDPVFGGPGLKNVGLTEQQQMCVRRFGPPMNCLEDYCKYYDCNQDTVGFFIAHFIKDH